MKSTGVRRRSSARRAALPGPFRAFTEKHPELGRLHEDITNAVLAAGPLDRRTCELIKIGVCAGAGLESALKSHVRRAREAGATADEIEQAILMTMTTAGFPRMVAAWTWARTQLERR